MPDRIYEQWAPSTEREEWFWGLRAPAPESVPTGAVIMQIGLHPKELAKWVKGKSCNSKRCNPESPNPCEAHPGLSITQDVVARTGVYNAGGSITHIWSLVRMAARGERAEQAAPLPVTGQQHFLKAK